jgi:hypothetical protein
LSAICQHPKAVTGRLGKPSRSVGLRRVVPGRDLDVERQHVGEQDIEPLRAVDRLGEVS